MTNTQIKNTDGSLDVRELFSALIVRWPWIVLSVVISLLVAFFYVYKKPNIYLRELTFISGNMTNDKNRSSITEDYIESMLPQNNISYNDLVLELTSPKIMSEVCHHLGLEFDYMNNENPLYGYQLPVRFISMEPAVTASGRFTVKVDKSGAILLKDFQVGENKLYNTYLTAPNDTLETPFGRVALEERSMNYWKKNSLELDVQVSRTTAVAKQYAGKLMVSRMNEKTSAISCRMMDQLPQRAEDVLNALLPVYCKQLKAQQTDALRNAGDWLQKRVNVIEGELGEIDSKKSDINQQYAVPNIASAAGSYFSESHTASTKKSELNTKISMINYLRSFLSETMKSSELLPIVSGIEDMSLNSQITEYNNLVRKRSNLIISAGLRHPQVVEIDKTISEARSILISTLDNLKDVTLAQITELNRVSSNANRKVVDMVDSEASQLSIERQQKVKESMYMYLLEKLEENYVNQTAINPTVTILSAATGSAIPIAPKRKQIFLLAFAIGVMIPVVIVFLLKVTDNRIHSRKDLASLRCAFVGEIPSRQKNQPDIVVKMDGNDDINEAFRIIRTNLLFMTTGTEERKKVLMTTSLFPGVGKTFITMNLGIAFALQGKRVLLIDFDMRKSSLSRLIQKPKRGISEYMNGSETNLELLKQKNVECRGLDLLPVGVEPPNPAELLSNEQQLKKLFDTVCADYDYILVDCPPFDVVADPRLINRYADITLFVLRAEVNELSLLEQVNQIYEDAALQHLSVLLNGVNEHHRYYSKKYKYGYRYGKK